MEEIPPSLLTPQILAEQLERLYRNELLLEAKAKQIGDRLDLLLRIQK